MRRILRAVFLPAALAAAALSLAQSRVDEARPEGELRLYTSLGTEDIAALAAAFEKKHGVKVVPWRSSSENLLKRIVTEARGGKHDFDVVETIGTELERLSREHLLRRIDSPLHGQLIAGAVPPHKEWAATRMNVFTQAYNTRLVKKEELPRTYDDLLAPRWKGRLGIEAEDAPWLGGVLAQIGEEKGVRLFREIARTNGLSARKGHTLLAQLVAAGEVPLALTVYNYRIEQLKAKGAPIEWFSIGEAVALPSGIGVAAKAPHPQAALLFYEFMLGDGQAILAARNFIPAAKGSDSPLTRIPIRLLDPALAIDRNEKWQRLFDEIVRQPRAR